jgi:hypothetical protein
MSNKTDIRQGESLRLLRSLLPLTAAAALLVTSGHAAAQLPRIPPDARGYQTTRIVEQAHQSRPYHAPTPASRATPSYRQPARSVSVSVTVPTLTAPASDEHLSIQGPNGEGHSFQPASGAEVVLGHRHIVLRPRESTTIQLTVAPRR